MFCVKVLFLYIGANHVHFLVPEQDSHVTLSEARMQVMVTGKRITTDNTNYLHFATPGTGTPERGRTASQGISSSDKSENSTRAFSCLDGTPLISPHVWENGNSAQIPSIE